MNEIISKIKKEMEKQGLSTPKMLKRIGESSEKEIRKTNRCLAGDTQRLDTEWVNKIYKALGIVAESGESYGEQQVENEEARERLDLLDMLYQLKGEELEKTKDYVRMILAARGR